MMEMMENLDEPEQAQASSGPECYARTCDLCGKSSKDIPWAKLQKSTRQPLESRCKYCAATVEQSYKHLGWETVVAKAKCSAEFAKEIAAASKVFQGTKPRSFPQEEVGNDIVTGYEVERTFSLISEADFKAKFSLRPQQIPGVVVESLMTEGGVPQNYVVMEDHSPRRLRVFSRATVVAREWVMPSSMQLRPGQSLDYKQFVQDDWKKEGLGPKALFQHGLSPPTLDELANMVAKKLDEMAATKATQEIANPPKPLAETPANAPQPVAELLDSDSDDFEDVVSGGVVLPSERRRLEKEKQKRQKGKGKGKTKAKASARRLKDGLRIRSPLKAATSSSPQGGLDRSDAWDSQTDGGSSSRKSVKCKLSMDNDIAKNLHALDPAKILAGESCGQPLYQARRKLESPDTPPADRIVLQAQIDIALVAQECAAGKIDKLSAEKREKLLQKLHEFDVVPPLAFQNACVAAHARQMSKSTPEEMRAWLAVVSPWRKEVAKGTWCYASPALSQTDIPETEAAQLAMKCLTLDMLVPGICQGQKGSDEVLQCARLVFEEASTHLNNASVILQQTAVEWKALALAMIALLSPEVAEHDSGPQHVRAVMDTKDIRGVRFVLKNALTQDKWYAGLVKDYLATATADMSLRPELIESLKAMQELSPDDPKKFWCVAGEVAKKVPAWRDALRAGSTLEETHLLVLLQNLLSIARDEDAPDSLEELVNICNSITLLPSSPKLTAAGVDNESYKQLAEKAGAELETRAAKKRRTSFLEAVAEFRKHPQKANANLPLSVLEGLKGQLDILPALVSETPSIHADIHQVYEDIQAFLVTLLCSFAHSKPDASQDKVDVAMMIAASFVKVLGDDACAETLSVLDVHRQLATEMQNVTKDSVARFVEADQATGRMSARLQEMSRSCDKKLGGYSTERGKACHESFRPLREETEKTMQEVVTVVESTTHGRLTAAVAAVKDQAAGGEEGAAWTAGLDNSHSTWPEVVAAAQPLIAKAPTLAKGFKRLQEELLCATRVQERFEGLHINTEEAKQTAARVAGTISEGYFITCMEDGELKRSAKRQKVEQQLGKMKAWSESFGADIAKLVWPAVMEHSVRFVIGSEN